MKKPSKKITGLLRCRNEELIIEDTIKHMKKFCDKIFVYDDCSTDDTVKRIRKIDSKIIILQAQVWSQNQQTIQAIERHDLFEFAKRYSDDEWFIYMDADERIEFDWSYLDRIPLDVAIIRMKLYDFYITRHNKEPYKRGNKLENLREQCGPEYRLIKMLFRPDCCNYPADVLCNREPHLNLTSEKTQIFTSGDIKHYGKSISIDHWEETCDHYIQTCPIYANKWRNRKGKAIHTYSDFGNNLIKWYEKDTKGFLL